MSDEEIHGKMVFRLSSRRSPKEVKLLHLEWAVVTQLDGEKTVDEIANVLALSFEESRQIFATLLKEGLLELVHMPEDDRYLAPTVFDEIEYELTVLLGPVAGILLDEVMSTIGRTKDKFDKNTLPIFLDFLANHITDLEKRNKFQKNIFVKLKKDLL